MTQECGHKSSVDGDAYCKHPLVNSACRHCPGESSCLIHRQAVALEAIAAAMVKTEPAPVEEWWLDPATIEKIKTEVEKSPAPASPKPQTLAGACGALPTMDNLEILSTEELQTLKAGTVIKRPKPNPHLDWVYVKPGGLMPDRKREFFLSCCHADVENYRIPCHRDAPIDEAHEYAWTYNPSLKEPAPWPEQA